ncbi:hypothetical protein [Gillisia marina]|uniref:hypothetical protein n=1 Tax=Gillisia marina TaxID=1167637 RepID=UPI00029A65C6|nr:hypothetical protein [Gillisia marina]
MDLLKELDNLDFSIKSKEDFSLKILNNPKHVKEVIDLLKNSDDTNFEKILVIHEYASRKSPTILVLFF